MSFLPDAGSIIDTGSGVLLVALGLWVARVLPWARVTAALALFSVSFGAMLVAGNLVINEPFSGSLQVLAAVLAAPALVGVVGLAVWFPRPLARPQQVRAAVVGAALVALAGAWVMVWPPEDGTPTPAPVLSTGLGMLQFGLYFAMLLMALRFAWARGPGAARERRLCALLGAGLLPWPTLFLMTRVAPAEVVFLWRNGSLGSFHTDDYVFFGLAGAAVMVVLGALWMRNTQHADPAARRLAWRTTLLVLAAPVAAEALLTQLTGPAVGNSGVYGATRIASVGALAYAILRYRVFDLDLRIKRTIQQGTTIGAFVGAYLVASEAARVVVGGAAGAAAGVLALGALVTMVAPIRAGAGRLADAAMPHVSNSPSYLSFRKLEVYRAALEQEAASGDGGPGGAGLAALRAELGLTDRDHAILLHAMRVGDDAPAAGLAPGDVVLGRYRVERLLGEGAHGRAYLARDRRSGRDVVVKAIRPERSGDASLAREARAMAAVRHPNVVELHAVEEHHGQVLIVMEHVAGGSLRARLERGALAPGEFRAVALDLLDGLVAVHASGAVHRDVKPSNILLTQDGRAKLADFGVAHLPGLETTVGGASDGTVIGTIPYMSPEQAKGRNVTVRSDLFSAAATLYEAWSGQPYLARRPQESPIELQMRAAAAGRFKGDVQPAELRAWFARALAPDPGDRFPEAPAMRAALVRALGGEPAAGPRRR